MRFSVFIGVSEWIIIIICSLCSVVVACPVNLWLMQMPDTNMRIGERWCNIFQDDIPRAHNNGTKQSILWFYFMSDIDFPVAPSVIAMNSTGDVRFG